MHVYEEFTIVERKNFLEECSWLVVFYLLNYTPRVEKDFVSRSPVPTFLYSFSMYPTGVQPIEYSSYLLLRSSLEVAKAYHTLSSAPNAVIVSLPFAFVNDSS